MILKTPQLRKEQKKKELKNLKKSLDIITDLKKSYPSKPNIFLFKQFSIFQKINKLILLFIYSFIQLLYIFVTSIIGYLQTGQF